MWAVCNGRRSTGASSLAVPRGWSVDHPGDAVPQGVTEVDHRVIEGLLLDGGPEFKLIAVTVAFVAVVSLAAQVGGEGAAWGEVER